MSDPGLAGVFGFQGPSWIGPWGWAAPFLWTPPQGGEGLGAYGRGGRASSA
jgi:hypothetical protein